MTLRKQIEQIVRKYEDGQNHDQGAFDDDCELCCILAELRSALAQPGRMSK